MGFGSVLFDGVGVPTDLMEAETIMSNTNNGTNMQMKTFFADLIKKFRKSLDIQNKHRTFMVLNH
jgi:hypothetical protein